MYLHLGQDTVITTETVIGIFDMDECTVSKKTRDYLTAAEKRGRVVNVSFELPKSFVVCEKNGKITVYISQLSSKTLIKRSQSPIRSLCTVDTDIKGVLCMKMRKCPYCGRRISYASSFASRRKAEYICQKCGKESKVAVDKKIILFFIVAVVISLAIMAGWILAGLVSNPLGILLVAIPLIIFTAASPNFVHYEPYKKYRKSMEAKSRHRLFRQSSYLGT